MKLRLSADGLITGGSARSIEEILQNVTHYARELNECSMRVSQATRAAEAAKAGEAVEAGRGFAAVAPEFRSLAPRSANSAKRISDIVVRSTGDIEPGHALTALAGAFLDRSNVHVEDIHAAINRVADLMRSGKKTSADNIVGELKTLNENTGENRTLVAQLAQAADALRRQVSGSPVQWTISDSSEGRPGPVYARN